MAKIILFAVTVLLAIYGLSNLIRFAWSLIIGKNYAENSLLLIPIKNGTAEMDLRHSIEIAENCGIDRVIAVECDIDGETKRIAETVANSKPFVEICDKNDRLSKIIL